MDRPTIEIYEARGADYESRRTPRHLPEAAALAKRAPSGPVADLGCGPGWYTGALGQPALALDAALAMLRRTREVASNALLVQADLQALPLRRSALGAAWARNSYVHLRSVDIPMALADLHRALHLGAPVELTFFGGEVEGRDAFPDDDFPGRWFSTWPAARLEDVLVGSGFDLDELAVDRRGDDVGLTVRATRCRTLPDTVGPSMRLLVCGLNPSLRAADAGVGFVTPGNRYWPAALATGLVSRDRDPRHALLAHGIGMTDIVKRATPRASALTAADYRDGVARLDRLCTWLQPAAICMVGLAGWRAAVDRKALAGWQDALLGGRPVYVMPSTSGLNAATSLDDLTGHLGAAVAPPPSLRH